MLLTIEIFVGLKETAHFFFFFIWQIIFLCSDKQTTAELIKHVSVPSMYVFVCILHIDSITCVWWGRMFTNTTCQSDSRMIDTSLGPFSPLLFLSPPPISHGTVGGRGGRIGEMGEDEGATERTGKEREDMRAIQFPNTTIVILFLVSYLEFEYLIFGTPFSL